MNSASKSPQHWNVLPISSTPGMHVSQQFAQLPPALLAKATSQHLRLEAEIGLMNEPKVRYLANDSVVHITIVEPGGFDTDGASATFAEPIPEYAPVLEAVAQVFAGESPKRGEERRRLTGQIGADCSQFPLGVQESSGSSLATDD